MAFKIGFTASHPEETTTQTVAAPQPATPRKSVVQVQFPQRHMTLFKCPKCSDGYMIVKMNPKNQDVFYGCTNYFSDTNKCTNMISLGKGTGKK